MPELLPGLTIRPATPQDYGAITALLNAVWPDEPTSERRLRQEDDHRDSRCKWARYVADVDGQLIAAGGYDQFPGMYHPDRYHAWVNVHPGYQGRGVGRELADLIEGELAGRGALSILTYSREDLTRAVRFASLRGYHEKMRYFESRLNVPAFDFTPYADVRPQVEAGGFRVVPLGELPDDDEHRRKLFDLFADIRRDVPRPEPATEVAFENFKTWHWDSPYFLPEAYFVVIDEATGCWAGSSALWKSDGEHLSTGLTGVRREYRRRRLALAMKLRGLQYARNVGVAEIRTGNETNNRPMLAINEALGFVKQPAWIDFTRVLRSE